MTTARLLVLGGTQFVGRAVVSRALADGWDVTALRRGTVDLPAGVRDLRGNRRYPDGLAALEKVDGEWDLVVDTWAHEPRVVQASARALADRTATYAYVSSRSVYAEPVPRGSDESAPIIEADPAAGDVPYDEAKAGGERAVVDAFGDRAVLLRAGLIFGPHENVGRVPWWLRRIARGGEVLAPGPAAGGLQFVDARDLAAFALLAGGGSLSGPYNVVAPVGHTTMATFLDACVAATGSTVTLRWLPPEAILAAGITPWSGLPGWLPPGADYDHLHCADVTRALEAGLRNRPVEETVSDTWAWLQQAGPTAGLREGIGLDPELEELALTGR